MIEVIHLLRAAADTLDGIRVHPAIQAYHLQSAEELTGRILVKIAMLEADRKQYVAAQLLPQVRNRLMQMRQAAIAADFDETVQQGVLLLDALPGEGQSGEKAPWEA